MNGGSFPAAQNASQNKVLKETPLGRKNSADNGPQPKSPHSVICMRISERSQNE